MRIPNFFRWLGERYPQIITSFEMESFPVDNLYLDITEIIHQCSYNNDELIVHNMETECQMVEKILNCLEKIFIAVQPRKHLFITVDGVVPCVKMNQQRQQRYRVAYDTFNTGTNGQRFDPDVHFDPNCIAPGTNFMQRLDLSLCQFFASKVKNDVMWRQCKLVYSGHTCPGEGRHKIIDFIRCRKMQKGYQPNETHCLYGLDADLIMLSLVSHEPYFVLLQEVGNFGAKPNVTHELTMSRIFASTDNFVLLHINILREYLHMEYRLNMPKEFVFDLENAIDDFVLICMLVGNDFLPCVPTMLIQEGSIIDMINLYKAHILAHEKYLTCEGSINWGNFEILMGEISNHELDFLIKKQNTLLKIRKARKIDNDAGLSLYEQPISDINDFKIQYYKQKFGFETKSSEWGSDMSQLKLRYIEGIQWIMNCYFQGVPSWNWYYPYYYAPLCSDLKDLQTYSQRIEFELGTPLLPYQQLLAIVPPLCYKTIPKSYHTIFLDSLSPLYHLQNFTMEIDMDGCYNPWEGVAKVPFIEDELLRQAYNSVNQDSSEENNVVTAHLSFIYNADNITLNQMESPHFGKKCFTCVDIIDFQFASNEKFIPKLTENTSIKSNTIVEGFGSFMPMKNRIVVGIASYQMNIFGSMSSNNSIVVTITSEHCPSKSTNACTTTSAFSNNSNAFGMINTFKNTNYYDSWIGTRVLVGCPHFKRAKVIAISEKYDSIQFKRGKKVHWSQTDTKYTKKMQSITNICRNKGICFSDASIFVHVQLETGIEVNHNQCVPKYSPLETLFPVEMVIPMDDVNIIGDQLYKLLDLTVIPLQHLQPVIYIGPSPGKVSTTWTGNQPMNKAQIDVLAQDRTKWNTLKKRDVYGSLAYIQKSSKNRCNISILVPTLRPVEALVSAQMDRTWVSFEQAISTLKTNKTVLCAISGSIPMAHSGGTIELGLCFWGPGNTARQNYCKSMVKVVSKNSFGQCTTENLVDMEFWEEYSNAGSVLSYNTNSRKGYQDGEGVFNIKSEFHDDYTWYLSMDAVNLIERYMDDLKPICDALNESWSAESVDLDMLLRGKWADLTVDDIVAKVRKWQEEYGVMNEPMINAEEECMENDILHWYEDYLNFQVSQLHRQISNEKMYRIIELKNILREHLFVPSLKISEMVLHLPNNLNSNPPSIGARVFYIYDSGIVPMGTKGTIVRIMSNRKYIEVVFDITFSGGTQLGGRISTNRGAIIDVSKVLIYSSEDSFGRTNKYPDPDLHGHVQYCSTTNLTPNSIFYDQMQSLFSYTDRAKGTIGIHNDRKTINTTK